MREPTRRRAEGGSTMHDEAPWEPPTTPVVDPTPVAEPTPVVDPTSDDEPSRRSRWVVVGASIALVAIVATGIFAIANLTGETTEGGADTPEELGDRLMAVIDDADVLGAIELLVPGERRSLGEPFVELVGELRRVEVLTEADLSQLDGIDVELTSETVAAAPTNVPDIVNVEMSADAVMAVDGGELPIGALITDHMTPEMVSELRGSRSTESDRFDMSLTAVEHDGSWYFSLFHTIAEAARSRAVPEAEIPIDGIGAVGADSPEGAVDLALGHVEQLDLRGLLRVLDPDTAAALQRYAPLFLDDAEAALGEIPLTWQVTERQIRVEGGGGARTAFVDRLTIDGTLDDVEFRLGFADGCLRAMADGESFEACSSDVGLGDLEDALDPEVVDLIDAITDAFADLEPSGLELHEQDGEWFVSPIGSMSELMLNVLRALDREEIDAIVAAFEPAIDALTDAVPDLFDDLDADADADAGALTAGSDAATAPSDEVGGVELDEEPPWMACYDEPDAAAATACFDAALASGEIEPASVPAVLRFPECGYADLSWSGEVYGLSDRDFIAAVMPASECFAELIDQGVVSAHELPNELVHPECFEGRNWYRVLDEPDFDARYYECIDERGGT